MTCGVCDPKAFRPSKGGRFFGYTAFPDQATASRGGTVPDLYFMGAQRVFSDLAQGNVRYREGFRVMCKVMRKGDRQLIDNPLSLGTKPEYQTRNLARIEAMGVEVLELTPEARRMRHARP